MMSVLDEGAPQARLRSELLAKIILQEVQGGSHLRHCQSQVCDLHRIECRVSSKLTHQQFDVMECFVQLSQIRSQMIDRSTSSRHQLDVLR